MYNRNRFHELQSALQKSIRWCEINESRYFAQELMNMGFPGGVFNRLMVIAAEDVGLADPSLLLYERECLDSFENLIKQYEIKKRHAVGSPKLCEVVDRAVIAAAIAHKSRLLPMASFATLFDIYQKETFKENLSTYLEQFTDAVKNGDEKQALYYAFVAGIFLNSKGRILTWIQRQGIIRNDIVIEKWAKESKRNKELLVFAGSVVLLFRDLTFPHGEYIEAIDQYFSIPIKKAQIPDRAIDKHTSAGKRRGRSLEHFFKEGASVKNERFPNDWEQSGKDAYFCAERTGFENTKKLIEAIYEKYKKSQKQKGIYNPITF
jgi:hypothetical protein